MKDREPNDLDEYLAEVEDGLFCISAEDRECLMRDLKAHVSELTTDPDYADRYTGRYGITRDQLFEEIGEPSVVALDYASSVRIVPSPSMLTFLMFVGAMFILMALIGIERIAMALRIADLDRWISYAYGATSILGGAFLFLLTMRAGRDLMRNRLILPFLIVILVFISVPISYEVLKFLFNFGVLHISDTNVAYLNGVILIDFLVIAMLGLYTSMRHIRVIEATRAAWNS